MNTIKVLVKFRLIITMILTVALLSGCEEDDDSVMLPKPTALSLPVDGEIVELDLDNGLHTLFEWETLPEVSGDVTYKVLFDKENTLFEEPVAVVESDNGGVATQLNITHAYLDQIASLAGIASKKSGVLKWAVEAYVGNDTITSVASSIGVKRPTSLGPVPEMLYLSGTATETSGTIVDAIPFKRVAAGEFELITSLKAGQYQISNSKDAGYTTYHQVNGELFRGSSSKSEIYEGEEMPQIIRVSFNNATGSVASVMAFELIITANHVAEFELNYVGNHKFEANKVIIHYLNPSDVGAPDWLSWTEDRYKFRAKTSQGEIFYGSYHDASMGGVYIEGMTPYSNRPDGQEPEGFYNVYYVQPNDDYWAGCWKMATKFDGVDVDVLLDFNPNGEYTHTINFAN